MAGSRPVKRTCPTRMAVVARMGAEYGGDVIKTIYSGNRQEFAKLVSTTTVPILVLAGPRPARTWSSCPWSKTALAPERLAITMGRNVWQRPCVEGMIAAAVRHRPRGCYGGRRAAAVISSRYKKALTSANNLEEVIYGKTNRWFHGNCCRTFSL